MIVSILVAALLVVCPTVIAITLPNGFVFDETPYLAVESRAKTTVEICERPNDGCSSDCSTQLDPCLPTTPYCVQNAAHNAVCSGNFPMNSHVCLTKAINNFICTGDGEFPDPTDCNKYHVCNGTAHSIVECPGSSQFSLDPNNDDPYMNPGNGEFSCRFKVDNDACTCDRFSCDGGNANSFTVRIKDFFHYAYCLELGTLRKTLMFKCPKGNRHIGQASLTSVDCFPLDVPAY